LSTKTVLGVFITGNNIVFPSFGVMWVCSCPSNQSYKIGLDRKCAVALEAATEGCTWRKLHYTRKRDKRYA